MSEEKFVCEWCSREFESKKGLGKHRSACKVRLKTEIGAKMNGDLPSNPEPDTSALVDGEPETEESVEEPVADTTPVPCSTVLQVGDRVKIDGKHWWTADPTASTGMEFVMVSELVVQVLEKIPDNGNPDLCWAVCAAPGGQSRWYIDDKDKSVRLLSAHSVEPPTGHSEAPTEDPIEEQKEDLSGDAEAGGEIAQAWTHPDGDQLKIEYQTSREQLSEECKEWTEMFLYFLKFECECEKVICVSGDPEFNMVCDEHQKPLVLVQRAPLGKAVYQLLNATNTIDYVTKETVPI